MTILIVVVLMCFLYRKKLQLGKQIEMMEEIIEELKTQSLYDDVTGLPNRRLFDDRLRHMFASYIRTPRPYTLLYLDLNNFKFINDTYGHSAGDEVLQETAYRLSSCIREHDTVARLGGDEFAVLIKNGTDARKIIRRMENKFPSSGILVGKQLLPVGISIGAVRFSHLASTAKDLIKAADKAMYQVKFKIRESKTNSGHAWGKVKRVAIK